MTRIKALREWWWRIKVEYHQEKLNAARHKNYSRRSDNGWLTRRQHEDTKT